jgi:hypothetical protein
MLGLAYASNPPAVFGSAIDADWYYCVLTSAYVKTASGAPNSSWIGDGGDCVWMCL